jgi:hypothetical protein
MAPLLHCHPGKSSAGPPKGAQTCQRNHSSQIKNKRSCWLNSIHPDEIKWRVVRTTYDGRRGAILPFANPRAYSDRLNRLFTPSGWKQEYTITHIQSLVRMEKGKPIVTGKVLVASLVTIHRLGWHCGTGEEWADRENAVTSADAQAFKRACSQFGLGRYLYDFKEEWVPLNRRGEPAKLPILPPWALPDGVVALAPDGCRRGDARGPTDPALTAKIEGLRETLGDAIYAEILCRAGHSRDAKTIPNADRQRSAVEWMDAAERGLQKVQVLAERVGEKPFMATVRRLAITSITTIPTLKALKQLVDALEDLARQEAA